MPVGHTFNVRDRLPVVSCCPDRWLVHRGRRRLVVGAAPIGILIDAEASTLRIGHVLADSAPEFAAAALGAIAERHQIGTTRAIFDHDLAELTAL